jgi:hypothetical protein
MKILIVDDENIVLNSCKRVLRLTVMRSPWPHLLTRLSLR